jgi:hypothetical protein
MDAACRLEVVNVEILRPGRRVLRCARPVPGDPLAHTRDGWYGIRLTKEVAQSAGIDVACGDMLLVRQVNPVTRRASQWCAVRVNGEPAPRYQREQGPMVTDQLGVVTQSPGPTKTEQWQLGNRPGNSPVWYSRSSEQRPVPVDADRLRVSWERGAAVVSTVRGKATTLGNLVQVENMKREQSSSPANLLGQIRPLSVASELEPVKVRVVRPGSNATSATYLAVPGDGGRLVPMRPEGEQVRVNLDQLAFSSLSRSTVTLDGAVAGSAGALVRIKNLSRGTELCGGVKSDDRVFAHPFDMNVGDAFEVRVSGTTIRGVYTGPGALATQRLAQ